MLQVRLHTGWVLEPDCAATGHHMNFHAEPRVVHHAHEVPSGALRLAILGVIPATHRKFIALPEVHDRDIHSPKYPTIHKAKLVWLLDAMDRTTRTVVCVAAHLIRRLRERDLLAV